MRSKGIEAALHWPSTSWLLASRRPLTARLQWSDGPVQRSYDHELHQHHLRLPLRRGGRLDLERPVPGPGQSPGRRTQPFYSPRRRRRRRQRVLGPARALRAHSAPPVAGMATAIDPGTSPDHLLGDQLEHQSASAQQEPQWPAGACPQFPAAPVHNTNAASFDAQATMRATSTILAAAAGQGLGDPDPGDRRPRAERRLRELQRLQPRSRACIIDGNSSPRLVSQPGPVRRATRWPAAAAAPGGASAPARRPQPPNAQKPHAGRAPPRGSPTPKTCKKGQKLKKGKCVKKKRKKKAKKYARSCSAPAASCR